jgi:hypothetical protein
MTIEAQIKEFLRNIAFPNSDRKAAEVELRGIIERVHISSHSSGYDHGYDLGWQNGYQARSQVRDGIMKIHDVVRTCEVCPSQWEARTEYDEPVYIRYRFGRLMVAIGQPGEHVWTRLSRCSF